MDKLFRPYMGRMQAEAQVCDKAAFLNLCAREGIRLSDTESIDDFSLRFRAEAAERERLETLAQRCGGSIRILRESAGERLRSALRSHAAAGAVTVLFSLLLLLSSLFLWEIDFREHPDGLPLWELQGALQSAGLRKGAFLPALSPELLASRALEQLPELESLTVNIRGSRALISAKGRTERPEPEPETGSVRLTADRRGVITELRVLSGTALVNPGMAVEPGEALVVPSATANRARAEIRGRCLWEKSAFFPSAAREVKATGGRKVIRGLIFGKRCIFFQRDSSILRPECGKMYDVSSCALPLGLCTLTLTEWESGGGEKTAPESVGERALLQTLDAELSDGGELLTAAMNRSGGTLTLRCECILPLCREESAEN